MSGIADAIDRIEAMVARRIARVASFRAVVTAVDGGLISIRRVGAATADERKYASVGRFLLAVGDEVLLVSLNGEPVVIDRIKRSAAATPTFAAQTGAGTTASTASSSGSDERGFIQLVPGGTGIAAGAQVTVSFVAPRPSANYGVVLQPMSSAARVVAASVGPTARTANDWKITADSALTSGSTYQWHYRVEMYGA